jgi:hydroxyacylglutathione hydrolase
MLRVIRLEVGELKVNCYLIYNPKTRNCIILDPGDEAEFIERKISENDLTPLFIIATHGHFDHVLASLELKLAYNIPFLISKKDKFLVSRADKSANYFGSNSDNLKVLPDKFLESLNEITLDQEKLKIIKSPGHTPGSVSFYSSSNKMIFIGDLFFADGSIGRYDFKYGDKQQLQDSIRRLSKLPDDVMVYSGHGPEFYLGDFKEINRA